MFIDDTAPPGSSLPQSVDVLVIGTGPSALFTSYLLHGYRPILPHSQLERAQQLLPSWLSAVLSEYVEMPLTDQALLERVARALMDSPLGARSAHPWALLLDMLERPRADHGEQHDSLLSWRRVACPIQHAVVGRTPPGGLWSQMDNDSQLALSAASQLMLPGYDGHPDMLNTLPDKRETNGDVRPTRANVAHYYRTYTQHTGIAHAIYSGVEVTQLYSAEEYLALQADKSAQGSTAAWAASEGILGSQILTTGPWRYVASGQYHHPNDTAPPALFTITARSVLLACGMFDQPRRLGVPGECANWVHHRLVSPTTTANIAAAAVPCLVVGSGLSAADQLHWLRAHQQPALHLFLSDTTYRGRQRSHTAPPLAAGYSRDVYPEYHATRRRMMRAQQLDGQRKGDQDLLYEGYADAQIIRFRSTTVDAQTGEAHGLVDLRLADGQQVSRAVTHAAVLIGRYTPLSFLRGRLRDVVQPGRSGESGTPLRIDPMTSQAVVGTALLPGLYGIGALTGDTTVRFGLGASLGALVGLLEEQRSSADSTLYHLHLPLCADLEETRKLHSSNSYVACTAMCCPCRHELRVRTARSRVKSPIINTTG